MPEQYPISRSIYDVVVGINLLREGLDLPEVSLVAILDADKQGFLRSATALIQTIGRAARHIHGKVIMYGDSITNAMREAIEETDRRRQIQQAYNNERNIKPVGIVKEIYDITSRLTAQVGIREDSAGYDAGSPQSRLPVKEIKRLIAQTEEKMKDAALALEFERAAALRDQMYELRMMLAEDSNLPDWEKISIIAGEEG